MKHEVAQFSRARIHDNRYEKTTLFFLSLVAISPILFTVVSLTPLLDKQAAISRALGTTEYRELRQATSDAVTTPGTSERALYQYSVSPLAEVAVEIVAIGTEQETEFKEETPTVQISYYKLVLWFEIFLVLYLVLLMFAPRRGWWLHLLSPRHREVMRIQKALLKLGASLWELSEEPDRAIHFGQQQRVWLAKARDLLTLGLQPDASLLKRFDEVAEDELKGATLDREAVLIISDILYSAADMILISPRARGSLVDELALASATGADAERAVETFEMKRALYASFAKSWPMRIVLVLLLVALSLTGWQVFELANLGVEARATVTEAKERIATTLTDARRLASEANDQSQKAAERLIAAAALQKTTREALVETSQSAIIDIEELKASAESDFQDAREKGLAAIKEQLGDQASVLIQGLSDRLEDLAKNGERDIQGKIEIGMGVVKEARSRASDFVGDTKDILAEDIENAKVQVVNFQETQRSDVEAYLQITKSRTETELNNRVKEFQKNLDSWEGVGKEKIDTVVNRVEAKELGWSRRSEDRFGTLEARANEIDSKLADADKRYQTNVVLLKQTNEIMGRVASAGRFDPVWLAAVLDLRTTILVVAALAALLAAAFAAIVVGSRRRSSS